MCTYLVFCGVYSLLVDKFFLGYSFNEAYHTSECRAHSEYKLLLFYAFSARHYFGSCVYFISQIMFLVFERIEATPCASSSFDNHMATNLFSVVWKFTTCWFFWRALPRYQIWSRVCFSADTYMANREWGPPMPISASNDREGWRRDGLSPL